jgi:pyridoxine 5-phosphate synthase
MASCKMIKLGVNIDHIATLRQARKIGAPDVLEAADACRKAGADGITVHLREDRRHIQDEDVYQLAGWARLPLNLEMSVSEDVVRVALDAAPDEACIVPEKRLELTTEGGLDAAGNVKKIARVVKRLKKKGIVVSLFIDPEIRQVRAAKECGADCVELHTGRYAQAFEGRGAQTELLKLKRAADEALRLGMILNAGHGLDYENTAPVARIRGMNALNIGFSIIARAVFTGLYDAVRDMKLILKRV